MKLKQKIKLSIIFAVEFITIIVILLLIFLAGKKSYTVTFDLNGGTLISGDVVQTVTQGKSATPPTVAKDGCYLHSWSASYRQITRDMVIEAVWEWETSVGFDYYSSDDSNYCEISSCFRDLAGDVYVGVYHDEKKVLGIRDGAFANCESIEKIHMLDGILSIGNGVFEGCTSLISIELPGTLTKLGENAFKGCTSLEKIVLPDGLQKISKGTFEGCSALTEVVIPPSVKVIEEGAFDGCVELAKLTLSDGLKIIPAGAFADCEKLAEVIIPASVTDIGVGAFAGEALIIRTPITEEEIPEGWEEGWNSGIKVEWGYEIPEIDGEEEEDGDKKGNSDNKKTGWL